MTMLDVLVRGAQRETQNVKNFVTTVKGPFETVDAIVKDARLTVREVGEQAGIRVPMYGQKLQILERLRRFRRY